MKVSDCKIKIIFSFLCLLVLSVGQEIQGQEKKPLNLNDITVKLTFTSRIDKSDERINRELTENVRKRKADFILESEDEKSLRKAGANDSLIQAIRESLPKEAEKPVAID